MGKGSQPIVGFHYRPAFHHGLVAVEIDAFLEFRGGDRAAWQGRLTASGTISINAPYLFGGEKDQGGLVGDVDVMFGESTQAVNGYLVSTFGDKTPAWRGFTTVVWKGGRYGAMNPYPKPASYKVERILKGWDGECWYPEKARIGYAFEGFPGDEVTADTIAHLPLDGAGGSTDFTDSIGNSWYRSSSEDPENTHIVGGLAYFSGRFDGADGAYLFCDDNLGPLTEFCMRAKINPDDAEYVDQRLIYSSDSGFQDIDFGLMPDGRLFAKRTDVFDTVVSTATIPPGQETDVALIVKDGFATLYIDKVQDGQGPADDAAEPVFASAIGRLRGSQEQFYQGYIRGFTITGPDGAPIAFAANPAHVLYEARTCGDMGREPIGNINDANLRAAADKLYAEGFGVCPKWDPASESVEDFENRICRLIGGSFNRSPEDGQWYLDLARGDYVLEDLPILTDDDILSFEEQPSTLDSAVNSVSGRYFDPERKEYIVTPPVRALGLVAAFGTIHETVDFAEIPTASLALRVALRFLLEKTTPTRVFDLVTTRRTWSWRPNTYFRLQTQKRGIADMVCVVGQKESGSLRSGAIKMKATQEPSSLPDTSFVEVEPGVDPTPGQVPTKIILQRAEEAPYLDVVAALSRADLNALPDDAGFAMAMAATAEEDLDFTLMVASDGGAYELRGRGEWCATATVVEPSTLEGELETEFTLADGNRLDRVEAGMPVLWGDELCRVDAIDLEADPNTITLGRGCGDTAPAAHGAGERLWFYQVGFAYDRTEYTDGESINVKLLSNTGSQQLSEIFATPMAITFDQRQARPYAPGRLLFTGLLLADVAYPETLIGTITTKWAHRDRVLQADQLVDTTEASVGPEDGTSYTVVYEQPPGSVVQTEAGITGTSATPYTFPSEGLSRISVTATRGGLDSWQSLSHSFNYLSTPNNTRVVVGATDRRVIVGGDGRASKG